ncbi:MULTISPECIES: hypothetical protein [Shewanella]|uniref:Uncharacterized protein n=2 Tax=Unclassified Bacteria TaxID=49928 RepID=A0AAU6VMN1_UNCXX|nr:hypothetical protein [Shewanella sp. K8]MDE0568398.1 hypothetical protein [Shewanella sp. K8]
MEWVIGIIVIIILGAIFGKPSSCDVCGQSIKKTYYKWTIGGKKQVMCPKCNSQMERKISKEAFNKKFN